jgi:hypothetical protein
MMCLTALDNPEMIQISFKPVVMIESAASIRGALCVFSKEAVPLPMQM